MSLSQTASGYLKEYSGIRKQLKLRWWFEIVLIVAFYAVYTVIRNLFGSNSISAETAFNNAMLLIDFERFFGLYQESRIQGWFLDYAGFLQFWNFFYGFFHFAVTISTFIWLYIRFPWDFAKQRTIGLLTTGLGLVGFAVFPVMPPRLLGDMGQYGGGQLNSPFVDTLQRFGGGLWSFDSGAVAQISNQYAAMPSIHIAWATWCGFVIFRRVKSPAAKSLAALYPLATLFAITVTGNHYWIDAVGGLFVLIIAYIIVNWVYGKYNFPKHKAVC